MNHDRSNASRAEAKLRRTGAYLGAVFCGGLFGLIVTFLVVAVRGRGLIPPISATDVATARQQWNAADVADYEITVVVRGHDVSTYRVTVRQGIVLSAWRNDRPLRQQRTLGTWSVPGMFETIEQDLNAIQSHQAGKSTPGTPQLLLRGEFDKALGYPRRYQRTEVRKFGSNTEVSWEVIEFRRTDTQ